jgi:hypothetical protein
MWAVPPLICEQYFEGQTLVVKRHFVSTSHAASNVKRSNIISLDPKISYCSREQGANHTAHRQRASSHKLSLFVAGFNRGNSAEIPRRQLSLRRTLPTYCAITRLIHNLWRSRAHHYPKWFKCLTNSMFSASNESSAEIEKYLTMNY